MARSPSSDSAYRCTGRPAEIVPRRRRKDPASQARTLDAPWPGPYLGAKPHARLTRIVRFAAAHRYYRPEWSDEENRRVFGLCANPHGHGHNYVLEVTVEGRVDPRTGYSVDLGALDALLEERVRKPLDHQHINHALPEFGPGAAIPTSESILLYLWPRIVEGLATAPGTSAARLVRLRLHEDDQLYVDYAGEEGLSPTP